MAVPFSNTKLRVPKGFQNILECLAREVLRSQPDNINEFAAAYFESLLRIRAETGHDPAVHGARLEDRNYNNEAYKKRPADPHEAQQRSAGATTIQTQFRQHSSKEEVQVMRQEDAAIKIQAGYRGYVGREQVRNLKDAHPDQEQEEVIDIDLSCPEVEKAAIKIQAGFKGFKARKEALATQDEAPEETARETPSRMEDETARDLPDDDVNQAATKIQAGFRGHSTRKQLKQGNGNQAPSNKPDNQIDDDLQDIDLEDPDLSKAALKIQAGFRGIRSRKEIQKKKELQQQEEQMVEEEVIDIDLNDPDVKKSAMLIQAGFKGLKARKHLRQKAEEKQQEEKKQEESQQEEQVEEGQKNVPEKDDQEEPESGSAAVKIQAAYRGYTTRKSLKSTSEHQTVDTADVTDDDNVKPAHDDEAEIDIDLTDPAVQKATMKLQAGFKGFKARKDMHAAELRDAASKEVQKKADEHQDEDKVEDGDVTARSEDAGEVEEGSAVEKVGDVDKERAVTKIQAGFRGMKAREQVKAIHNSRKGVEENETECAEVEVEYQFEEEPDEM